MAWLFEGIVWILMAWNIDMPHWLRIVLTVLGSVYILAYSLLFIYKRLANYADKNGIKFDRRY